MREALREGARWRTSALGRVKQGAVLTGTGTAMRGRARMDRAHAWAAGMHGVHAQQGEAI